MVYYIIDIYVYRYHLYNVLSYRYRTRNEIKTNSMLEREQLKQVQKTHTEIPHSSYTNPSTRKHVYRNKHTR